MRTIRGLRSLTVAGLLAVLAPVGRAEDKVIPVDQLPRAVSSAAKAKFPGAQIQRATEETEDGKPPVYSLEMKHQRHDLDVTFQGDGTVVLASTSVAKKELPKAALRAAAQRYPDASLRHAGAVRKGPEVKKAADYYELYLVTADNRPRPIKVDPKGKILEDPFQRVRRAQPPQPEARAPRPRGSKARGKS